MKPLQIICRICKAKTEHRYNSFITKWLKSKRPVYACIICEGQYKH